MTDLKQAAAVPVSRYQQFLDAFLIVRVSKDGSRRVIGTAHSQAVADIACCDLAKAFWNMGTGFEYVTERNPKYLFDDALRVIGEVRYA